MGLDYPILVGDFACNYLLQETFRSRYQSVKVYGFVNFGDENEQVRAYDRYDWSVLFLKSRDQSE